MQNFSLEGASLATNMTNLPSKMLATFFSVHKRHIKTTNTNTHRKSPIYQYYNAKICSHSTRKTPFLGQ